MVITIGKQGVKLGKQKIGTGQFCQLIAQNSVTGMRNEPIPDNVKWLVECGKQAVYILELQPELRLIQWRVYDYYENEDGYCYHHTEDFTVATPYVVVKVPFFGNSINGSVDVFYRNQPLRSIDDELCHTNLRNVAQFEHSLGHLCLDGLRTTPKMNRSTVLGELVNHLWSGEFNNELGLNFECFATRGGDKRLSSIERWQKASKADPSFVLGVKWFPAKVTVRNLIEKHFTGTLQTSTQLVNLILKAR